MTRPTPWAAMRSAKAIDAAKPMPTNVATPRRPVSTGLYRGDDLRRTSPRAGAYDAFSLPSVMGGRLVTREQQREELLAPTPPVPAARQAARVADPQAVPLAQPPDAPYPQPEAVQPPPIVTRVVKDGQDVQPLTKGRSGSLSEYRPRAGSGPHRVLVHLQTNGGHLLYTEARDLFAIPHHSLTAIFKPALVRGALIRVRVGDRLALALPGYVPPAPAPASPPSSTTPASLAADLAAFGQALQRTAEQLALLRAQFLQLQRRDAHGTH